MFGNKSVKPAKLIAYAGICLALATALSYITVYQAPQGGSVTPMSMFFVAIIGWWFGPVVGVSAGVAYGFLQLLIKPQIYYPLQVILDYPLAFGALGLMGIFRTMKTPNAMHIGFGVAALGRAFFSYLSGVVFFQEYIPSSWGLHPWLYSAAYNLGYIVPEVIITFAVISIPSVAAALKRVSPS